MDPTDTADLGFYFRPTTSTAWLSDGQFLVDYKLSDAGSGLTADQEDIVRFLLLDAADVSTYSGSNTISATLANSVTYRVFFSDIIDIHLSENSSGPIQIVRHEGDDDTVASIAKLPDALSLAGSIVLNELDPTLSNLLPHENGFWLLAHELTHAIGGLNDISDTSLSYTNQHTIMSYDDYNGVYATGLQLLDIIAVQESYGNRNYATRSTNTVYSLGNGLGFSGATEADPFLYTIWDGNGVDCIDASSFTLSSAVVDLRQGRFSSIGVLDNNVAIAYYTVIENAIGTGLNDTIIGNAWDNRLEGGFGNVRLYGDGIVYTPDSDAGFHDEDTYRGWSSTNPAPAADDSGNDTFIGGEGDDEIYGGLGTDTADYSTDPLGIAVTRSVNGDAKVTDGYGDTDTLFSIEKIIGTSVTDKFYSGTNATWAGNAGNDEYHFFLNNGSGNSIVETTGTDTVFISGISTQKIYTGIYAGLNQDRISLFEQNDEFIINVQRFDYFQNTWIGQVAARFDIDSVLNGTTVENVVINSLKYQLSTLYSHRNDQLNWTESQLSVHSMGVYDFATGSDGYGAGGNLLPQYDDGGDVTEMIVNPASYASANSYFRQYADVGFHPMILTTFYTGGGATHLEYQTSEKSFRFKNGIDIDDVRFNVTNSNGNAALTIYIDSIGKSYSFNDFEAGKVITGYASYNNSLHSSVQSAASATLTDRGNSKFSGDYTGGSFTSPGSTLQQYTLFLEKVSFADGGSINMLGSIDLKGTVSGETLYGMETRNDTILGLGGNDTINAKGGNDVLVGGLGNDNLYGGAGNDAYFFDSGFGQDEVQDTSGTDEIRFGAGITLDEIRFWRTASNSSSLTIYVEGTANNIVLQYQLSDLQTGFENYDEIETIRFFDNSTLSLNGNYTYTGTTAGENVSGSNGNDKIIGLAGNDNLSGQAGNDVYFFNSGFGQDEIQDSAGIDEIVFGTGITLDELRFWRTASNSSSLTIYVEGTANKIVIEYQLSDLQTGGNSYDEIETIRFSDNSTFSLNGNYTYTGTTSAETVNGANGNDKIIGLAGNDNLYGQAGNDVYFFDSGFGQDEIQDSAGIDEIVFGTGITLDELRFWRTASNSSSLTIYVEGTANKIVIEYQLSDLQTGGNSYDEIEAIRFFDNSTFSLDGNYTYAGTTSAENVYGANGDDVIYGLGGNDSLYGYDGFDTIIGGAGADNLYGGNGSDTFLFDTASQGSSDFIADFSLAQLDKIDLSDILQGYNPLTHAIEDFVQITTSGANSILKVDVDGGANNFVQIATIAGATGLTDEAALVISGNLIVS